MSGAGGRARPRNGERAHPALLEAARTENLQRDRYDDQPQASKRHALLALELREARALPTSAQMRAQVPALSPGEASIEVARDRSPGRNTMRRRVHLIVQMLVNDFSS